MTSAHLRRCMPRHPPPSARRHLRWRAGCRRRRLVLRVCSPRSRRSSNARGHSAGEGASNRRRWRRRRPAHPWRAPQRNPPLVALPPSPPPPWTPASKIAGACGVPHADKPPRRRPAPWLGCRGGVAKPLQRRRGLDLGIDVRGARARSRARPLARRGGDVLPADARRAVRPRRGAGSCDNMRRPKISCSRMRPVGASYSMTPVALALIDNGKLGAAWYPPRCFSALTSRMVCTGIGGLRLASAPPFSQLTLSTSNSGVSHSFLSSVLVPPRSRCFRRTPSSIIILNCSSRRCRITFLRARASRARSRAAITAEPRAPCGIRAAPARPAPLCSA